MNYLLSPNSVSKLKTLFAGVGAVSSRQQFAGVGVFDADFPLPYEVRYAASANSGGETSGESSSGAWIMWLGGGQLLSVAGETIDAETVKGDLADVGSPYPDGWVSLAGVMPDAGGQLWMRVTVPKSTDDAATDGTASLSSAAGASSPTVEWIVGDTPGETTESTVYSIPIALTSRDATSGETKVKQQTHGFVNFTAGGDGLSSVVVKSGSDSNVVGTGEIANGVLTLTLDVYYK